MTSRSRCGPRSGAGFSLVEVALSLAVVAFALSTLLGLLGAATDTTRASGRDTALVAMTSSVMANFRSMPFDQIDNSTWYFTSDGTMLLDSAGKPLTSPNPATRLAPAFVCVVTKTPDEATRSLASSTSPGTPYNLLRLQLNFAWPASASVANRQSKSLYASIARYD